MLRQIRHISEGNFYGLHVTNKARKLSLQKELKTLEACQDAQTHGYRKEEKELVETLKRLNRSKDANHEHDPETNHRPPTRPSSPVGADDLSTHHSAFVFNKPATGVSNVSIVIPLSPVASSKVSLHEEDDRDALLMNSEATTNTGSELHRTTAFMDCALCKLPRYERGQRREAGRVCTCGPEHRRHIHVDKYQEEGKKPHKKPTKHTKEELVAAVQQRDRRKSLETDHMVHDFLATLNPVQDHKTANGHQNRQAQHAAPNSHGKETHSGAGTFEGGERRGSIGERLEPVGSNLWSALESYEGHIPKIGAQRRGSMAEYSVELPARSRRSSIEEQYGNRSRRGSLEEYTRIPAPGNRRLSYNEHNQNNRSRSLVIGNGEEQNRRRGFSFEGHRSRRSSMDGSSFPCTYRNTTVSTSGDVHHVRAPPQLPSIPYPQQMPAFHGLLHPDNIINHHHFLPHEAEKHDQLRRASFDRNHGYYPHGDHPYSHVAAAFDRRHEQDCSNRTHHTISTLRRMLQKYQDRDSANSPNYPWPRPPVIEFTPEEFQKLKKCRYLRIPQRNNEDDLELGESGNGTSKES